MLSTSLVALTAIFSLPHAVESGDTNSPGYVSFPLTRRTHPDVVNEHDKRHVSVPVIDRRQRTLYTVDVTLGTPRNTVPLMFDTGGNSDFWVNPICEGSDLPEFCSEQPQYKWTESETVKVLGMEGHLKYVHGRVDFQYMQDKVSIGSVEVASQYFGVAYESKHMYYGVLGAGPSPNNWVNNYPSLYDNLVDQGHIQSRSFGINLRGFPDPQGAITFGGLDTAKFKGGLEKLPVVAPENSPGDDTRWWVTLDAMSIDNGDGVITTVIDSADSPMGQVVLLDSGYTTSALPSVYFKKLLAAFPSAKKRNDEMYRVDCLPDGEGGFLSFTFGGITINVSYYDMIFHPVGYDDYCVLGFYEDDNLPVLGDNILRDAYVVFDFDHKSVHIGQADDCGSNIVPIGANGVTVTQGDCG